jgi:colicin import membrane protein
VIDLIRQYPRAFLFSILLHGLIIGLALLEFNGTPRMTVVSHPSTMAKTIKAEVIDQQQLEQRAEIIKQQQEEKIKQAQEKKRQKLEAEKRARELAKQKAEREKKAVEARKQAEAEKKQKAEQARKAKAEAEKKLKEEQRKKAEAEQKRKAEEARLKAEAEKKRKEEELKRQQEAARKEAERQARLKAEAEQRQKEAELKAQLADEERQRALNSMKNRYRNLITQKITRNWRQPLNAGNMPLCVVRVLQGPGGVVLDVIIKDCPGTREYRLSVEAAVLKSDPLPTPEDPSLFDRELEIHFKPKAD